MLLHNILIESSRRKPERIAVTDNKKSISYRQLNNVSGSLAEILLRSQTDKCENIGIFLDKSVEAVISIFGILKAGAAYVPLDVSAPVKRLEFIVKDTNMKTIITDKNKLTILKSISSNHKFEKIIVINYNGCVEPEDPEDAIVIFDEKKYGASGQEIYSENVSEDSPAYILYTSGSTGNPKGVVLSHRNALSFIDWAFSYFKIDCEDVLSSHAPFYFDLSIFDIFVAIKAGAKLCLIPKSISSFPVSLGKFIEENGITTWYSVPSVLVNLALYGKLESLNLKSLKRVIYAGEQFPVKHLKNLARQLPHVAFYNLYGPTETNVITYYRIDKNLDDVTEEVPIGYPCPYADVKVITEENRIAQKGQKGELIVRGDSLMLGYFKRPDLTEKSIRRANVPELGNDLYYHTGDIVRVIDDGCYQFIGRKDNMVKVKGFRIELEEVEANLLKHEYIKECIVKCIKDASNENRLKAYIVSEKEMSRKDVVKFLKKSLPDYMIPDEVEFCSELKKNSRGKVNRLSDE